MFQLTAAFFRIIAGPFRIGVLEALGLSSSGVRAVGTALGFEQTNVSQQLAMLRAHDLLHAARRGAALAHQISDPAIRMVLDSAGLLCENRLGTVRTTLETLRSAP